MAKNDFQIYDDGTTIPGSKRFKVHGAGRANGINAGEFVLKGGIGNTAGLYATAWTPGGAASSAKPVVGTDYLLGFAMSTSTEIVGTSGTVDVIPNLPGMTYLGNADTAATFGVGSTPVQATYDALVGARVLFAYSAAGVFTILAADSSTSGVIIEPMDVTLHTGGKVRFSLRQGLNYFA